MLVAVVAAPTVFVLAVTLLLAAHWTLVLVTVDGGSMAPAFQPGDRVLVLRRHGRRVGRGRVVVVEQPEAGHGWDQLPPADRNLTGRHWYLKRVAAVAGDPVPVSVAAAVGAGAGAQVPPGGLVLLGDAERSDDSRQWGYFPADRVLGVVVLRLRRPPP
ncbi:MAG TPA: S26 family signal peptidase [Mycobacteriales bacterium]|nr:S26 family signal peptidase [Mycobacteriales bacterium]